MAFHFYHMLKIVRRRGNLQRLGIMEKERNSSEVRNTEEGGIKTEGSIAENHRGALH